MSHTWRLDAQGNWRKHWEGERDESEVPEQEIDPVNAYLGWTSNEDADGDGVLDLLSIEYDGTRGFLWRRQVAGEWRRYVHDGLGRLVGVQRETESGPEWIARYGYDAEGRVAFREEGSGTRTWILRDGDRAVLEVKEDGTLVRRNVWLGSRLVRSEEPTASGWDLPVYAHQDRLGSVVLTTKKDGDGAVSVTGRSTYDPYGKEVSLPSWTGSSVTVPYGFAGARRDDEVGLYRMGARWYDPELGRFLEQDPIGESGGLNLYAYVGSSPVMWVDPTGLSPITGLRDPRWNAIHPGDRDPARVIFADDSASDEEKKKKNDNQTTEGGDSGSGDDDDDSAEDSEASGFLGGSDQSKHPASGRGEATRRKQDARDVGDDGYRSPASSTSAQRLATGAEEDGDGQKGGKVVILVSARFEAERQIARDTFNAKKQKLEEVFGRGNVEDPHLYADNSLFLKTLRRNDVRAVYYETHGRDGVLIDALDNTLSPEDAKEQLQEEPPGSKLEAVVISACEAGNGDWESAIGHGVKVFAPKGRPQLPDDMERYLETWLPYLATGRVP